MAGSSSSQGDGSSNIEIMNKSSRTAPIWEHFDLVKKAGNLYARCHRCGKLMTSQGNSSLGRHWNGSCLRKNADVLPEQQQIGVDAQLFRYDNNLARDLGMKLVIQEGLPFDFFARKNVINFIRKALQPQFCQVSRYTLKRDALKKFTQIHVDLKEFFNKFVGRIALTSDIWSSPFNTGYSYICVTVHWIDPQTWFMQKRILAFENFPNPHGGEQIYDILMRIINAFNIKNKIISISLDNASNNNSSMVKLKRALNLICNGRIFHIRCCCHIFNLAVQDGFTIFNTTLVKFRTMNRLIFQSGPIALQKYKRWVHSKNARVLKMQADTPIRWNSTYLMIKRLIKQKDLLTEYYREQIFQIEKIDIHIRDWEELEELYDILGVLYEATLSLSHVYFPTVSRVLINLEAIVRKLGIYRTNPVWKPVVDKMIEKLSKYFKEIPPLFMVATALSPMFNSDGTILLVQNIGGGLRLNSQQIKHNIDLFEFTFKELFSIYNNEHEATQESGGARSSVSVSSSGGASSSQPQISKKTSIYSSWFSNLTSSKRSKTTSSLDELSIYTETNYINSMTEEEFIAFDILKWWHDRQKNGPFRVLATMARDVLTVQASTVASESCFSISGRLINARRTLLTPESVQMCIMLKDYYDSITRTQNQSDLEEGLDIMETEILEDEKEATSSRNSTTSYYSEDLQTIPETQLNQPNESQSQASQQPPPWVNYDEYNFFNLPPEYL